ncbi:MAG: ABC transporter substrate-binding protein [Thermodesulfobacteriota bacterium]
MKKNLGIFLLAVLILAGGIIFFTACEPESKKKFTIGVVNPNPGTAAVHDAFIDTLQEAAEKEGWILSFIICKEKKKVDTDIKEMVLRQVDMIFSITTPATKKVKKAIAGKGVPAVFAVHDPVKSGIIESMQRPGGDLTGVKICGSIPKALDWLLAIVPDTSHIYVPIRLDTKAAQQSLDGLQQIARSLDIHLTVVEVNDEAELDKALLLIPADVDAIFMLHSMLISTHAQKIAEMANAKKIPTAAAIGKCQQGALISFSPELPKIGKQASRIALQVLKGEAVGDIPAEIAEFELGINLQSAEKLGIEVPNNILISADYIIR